MNMLIADTIVCRPIVTKAALFKSAADQAIVFLPSSKTPEIWENVS